jgi:predicted RNase H-like HicB family nuclease
MKKRFTFIIRRGEPNEGGFWATCPEVPGANGQGETKEAAVASLREAIILILKESDEDR